MSKRKLRHEYQDRLKELAAMHRLEFGDDYLEHCSSARAWLSEILAQTKESELAVFAYASLTWKPNFKPVFVAKGRLHGFRRQPCIYSTTYRGTRKKPGLVAGLLPGGSVTGLIQGLTQANRAKEIKRLFNREMFQGVYYPRIVKAYPVDTPKKSINCLTFIANPYSPAYAEKLSATMINKIIGTAKGKMGPCRNYWLETTAKLAEHGITSIPPAGEDQT